MKVIGIIPARYASTRFPGKPLVDIMGKSMIQRVYERSIQCTSLAKVVVATDDSKIFDHVKDFGGEVVMTADTHQSGTDRCAEVSANYPGYPVVINIQGDEPFIDPEQIAKVAACFDDTETQLATLIKKINTYDELNNPNSPKVIVNTARQAIYFSRAPLPYLRNAPQSDWLNQHTYYKHIGIYGYRADVLMQLTRLSVSSLEKAENLEQLRWIENGYRIRVAETDQETLAIDTPADLERILYLHNKI
jgi:3-deoxy-manno-octulosonate cytidylyltransferase (CMP-KDO synthetase)